MQGLARADSRVEGGRVGAERMLEVGQLGAERPPTVWVRSGTARQGACGAPRHLLVVEVSSPRRCCETTCAGRIVPSGARSDQRGPLAGHCLVKKAGRASHLLLLLIVGSTPSLI